MTTRDLLASSGTGEDALHEAMVASSELFFSREARREDDQELLAVLAASRQEAEEDDEDLALAKALSNSVSPV